MRVRWIASICLLISAAATAQEFTDPAPPILSTKTALTTPIQPRPTPTLTFHAPPKPLAAGATTHDWEPFLGPSHNATSTETHLLKTLPPGGPKVVWEITKGSGYAAPAISNRRLILFHRVGDEEVIECLHAETGQRYWRAAYPTAYEDRYGYSGGPRCSPVISEGRVYTYGAEGKLHCLDLETGHIFWKRELLAEFKVTQNFFGVGATALIEANLLIINIGAPNGPCVVALDKSTGKLVWGAGKQWGPSYASPIPATFHGQRRILVFAGGESRPATGGLICLNPKTGRIDFEFPWRARRFESVNASSPLVIDDKVFISECYGRGSALLRIKPDFTPELLWQNEEFGTHFMTALHKDGHLYGVHGHGPDDSPIVCLDLATGMEGWRHEPRWPEQVERDGQKRQWAFSTHRAQFLHANGQTLALTEYGHLLWLDLNPKAYKELSRSWLFFATETWTPPVLSHGLLYISQNNPDVLTKTPPRLLCYDLRSGD